LGALADSAVYDARIETLLPAMLQDENVHLPAIAGTILPTGAGRQDVKVSEVVVQILGKFAPRG
jgi:hypothetical protein